VGLYIYKHGNEARYNDAIMVLFFLFFCDHGFFFFFLIIWGVRASLRTPRLISELTELPASPVGR
jgi:hypothetical protein